MGRVKTEKAPAPPVNTGPTKRGGLELNTAKEAKKPKFAKKWAELHGGAEPRMEFFKSEKAQGKGGKAETSLSLRDEPDLPGLLQRECSSSSSPACYDNVTLLLNATTIHSLALPPPSSGSSASGLVGVTRSANAMLGA